MAAVSLILMATFAAIATVATAVTRTSSATIASNTAPSLIAVQGLSASLAEANAAATATFLSGTTGTEDRGRRVQYLEALARAAEQAETVAGLVGDDEVAHQSLQTIAVALTSYSGKMEAARTANQANQPDANDTLGEALDLTRGDIADAVATLTEANQQRFDDESGRGLWFIAGALGLGVLTVALLIRLQFSIYRRSNRLFNLPLVGATLVMMAMIAIVANGTLTRVSALSNADQGGYDAIVATSRLQSSANNLQSELALVLLGSDTQDIRSVSEVSDRVAALADGVESTRELAAVENLDVRWDRYRNTLSDLVNLIGEGETGRAIAEFQGPGLSTFNGLNTSIESVLTDNQTQFNDGVDVAASAMNLLPLLTLVGSALAALGVLLGVQQRLKDYQ